MANMDIFNQDAFSLFSMTDAINQRPFVPSMIRSMGLFRSRGVTNTTIGIERRGTSLALVPSSPRGSAPVQRTQDRRELIPLQAIHLAKEVVIYADQVQGVRQFGRETETEMVMSMLSQETDVVRTDIDLTEENLMLGALRGEVLDADGSSVLYNLFDKFGVTAPTAINFALATDTTKVRTKCTEVIRTMATAMQAGGMPFGVTALCSDTFFDDLINHPDVETAYERWQDGAQLRDDYTYQSFPFAGINFVNYRASDDGTVGIDDGDAQFFATGVPGLFEIAYAPADTMATVNTIGLPRYAIPGMDTSGKDKFMSYEIQANPLPYCTRPQTLLTGTAS